MRQLIIAIMLLLPTVCTGLADPNDLPNRTIARADCCGPTCKGSLPQGTLNQVFVQTVTPSDLKCYPYEITKPGNYVITRDFLHVPNVAGEPLIKVLSSNVTIDFQTFSLYQNVPTDQIDGTNPLLSSDMITIGDGTNAISNVSIVNGTIRGAAGVGISVNPNVSNVTINSLRITNCLAGGVAISGAYNVDVECCSITNHGNQNIISNASSLIIPLNSNLLDAGNFALAGSTHLGGFGVLAYNSRGIAIKDSEVLNCGATVLENDAIGIYAESCNDIEVVRCASSGHLTAAALTVLSTTPGALDAPYLFAKGMFFKNCNKGFVDCCLVNCNKGAGVVGIDLINSDHFHISNTNIIDNCANGSWLNADLPGGCPCPGPETDFDLFIRCTPCDDFVDSMTNINLQAAYTDYKAGLILPKTDPSCIANWQMPPTTDPADWTTFMNGMHAIEYALEYYTNRSRAYGIRLFDTNYVTVDGVSVIDTVSENNSAWGILIDRNTCNMDVGEGGLCNVVKFSKVLGTRSFANSTDPNIAYAAEIESFFGDILDASNLVRRYESISMIGRAIGIEVRNCADCTVIHSNLIKGNFSEHTFAAGLFLNRSSRGDIVGNRIECNCGSDTGYGILNRTVDPTDMTASTTLYANGLMDRSNLIDASGGPVTPPFYPFGTSSYDKNINYGVFWANGGVFTVKHAFTSDLTVMNNIGTNENLQVFFDAEAQLNLPCTITAPDVDASYVV